MKKISSICALVAWGLILKYDSKTKVGFLQGVASYLFASLYRGLLVIYLLAYKAEPFTYNCILINEGKRL